MTHYEVLGVGDYATADEIRQAYRRRARDHHPDANPQDSAAGERFRRVALAYQVLSDPAQRARYDASLRAPGPAPGAAGAGSGVGDVDVAGGTSPSGRRPWPAPPRPPSAAGAQPGTEPGVADRIVQAVFVLPVLAVPGIMFPVRLILLVAAWFVAGYLLRRHAAATPRDWPWWRSPGWTGGGRLIRVGAVVAGLVVAGAVLGPLVERARDAIDAQGIVEDAVTADAAQPEAQASAPDSAAGLDVAI
ncbi:MAG TPA: J domain-containing protein, partial [Acidimicrobiales bacterium]